MMRPETAMVSLWVARPDRFCPPPIRIARGWPR